MIVRRNSSRGTKLRDRNHLRPILERHYYGHPDLQLLRRAANQIGHHRRPFIERHQCDDVGNLFFEGR